MQQPRAVEIQNQQRHHQGDFLFRVLFRFDGRFRITRTHGQPTQRIVLAQQCTYSLGHDGLHIISALLPKECK